MSKIKQINKNLYRLFNLSYLIFPGSFSMNLNCLILVELVNIFTKYIYVSCLAFRGSPSMGLIFF